MKKFLLSIFCTLSAVFAFASDYDTIFVKPGVEFNYKLVVDTVKHPALSGDNYSKVAWYRGYEKETYQDGETIVGETLQNVITLNGEKIIHFDNVKNGNTLDGFVFYGYKLDLGTKAISDNLLTKTKANALTTDTVAFIHVLKELNKDNFTSFTMNKDKKSLIINEGDSVEFNIVYNDAIDVQKYSVVSISEDKKDTTIIVTSDKPYFKVPLSEMEKTTVYPMVSNEIGNVVRDGNWGKEITVRPSFKVESVSVSVVSGSTSKTDTFNETNEANISVYNHDSLTFVVNTNIKETGVKYVTNWTLNGKQVLSDSVTVSKDGLSLAIQEFRKPDMDGVYKCMILNSENGNLLGEAIFNVKSEYPTSNEDIVNVKPSLVIGGNTIYSKGYEGYVYLYTITGQMAKTFRISQGEAVPVTLTNGIYIAKFGKETVKFIVK